MAVGAESPGDRIAAWLGAGAGWIGHRADVSHWRCRRDGALHAASAARDAVFFVAPVMALVTLVLVYRAGARLVRRGDGAARGRTGGVESGFRDLCEAADERRAGDGVGDAGDCCWRSDDERDSGFCCGARRRRGGHHAAGVADRRRDRFRSPRIAATHRSAACWSAAPAWRSAWRSRWRFRISCSDRRSRPATAPPLAVFAGARADQPGDLRAAGWTGARPVLACRD